MKKPFFSTKSPSEVFELFPHFPLVDKEKIPLEEAKGRVLAEDITANENLPGFERATMDGYALKAEDTFGASEASPIWLNIIGEVKMGKVTDLVVKRGEAVKIATGAMLPQGANAVIMVEYTHMVDKNTIEVFKPLAPLENVIRADEDFAKGELVLSSGHRLRPQDIGVLAALGKAHVQVFKQPSVAIISTGDEIIPITEKPQPGQVRDVNSYTLYALVREGGGIPWLMGIVKDDLNDLKKVCKYALDKSDVVLISGGSSIGMRDFTLEVINSFPESQILFHGVAISPGKPTILAKIGKKAVWGLPGQVTSAIIVFWVFIKKFIQWIGGEREAHLKTFNTMHARMRVNVPSVQGREDYLRVKLVEENGQLWAEPIWGKSGLINTLVKANGLVKIDLNTEGLDKEEIVEVILI